MLIKTVVIEENGTMQKIYKNGEDNYSIEYYEFYTNGGWRFICEETELSEDLIIL